MTLTCSRFFRQAENFQVRKIKKIKFQVKNLRKNVLSDFHACKRKAKVDFALDKDIMILT